MKTPTWRPARRPPQASTRMRLGFHLSHMVQLPSFSESHGVERGNRSICSLQHQCSHAHINNMRGSISSPRMVSRVLAAQRVWS
ncbi:hypothetical protein PF003_g35246 [Phytophthora fragariae]|nr:hypothetical protein PF003_g35246 [Phytophthora fragariae]